ncbi:MAG: hypothetical protein JO126_08245 [Alphaproteobacteria bacterium]|nr:hypothetical protein [Alphaproteobacteria bacterium]MBV8549431.1 hypothetical protein [Alphaproteobacteria bacterium]
MPYITRDATGKITRACVRPLVNGEQLPHSHPEVLDFLTARGHNPQVVADALEELRRTDAEMSRAIEDLIMVLMKKNVFRITDLPKPVQDRMSLRMKLRVTIEEAYDKASGGKG